MFQSCCVHHGSSDRIIIITIIDRIAATVQPPPLVIQYRRHQHDCHRNNHHCRRGQGWTWLHTTQSLSPWSLSEHNHQQHRHHRNNCHCRRGQGWAWLGTRWTVGGGSPRTRHLISFLLVISMMHSDKGNDGEENSMNDVSSSWQRWYMNTIGHEACIHHSLRHGETLDVSYQQYWIGNWLVYS